MGIVNVTPDSFADGGLYVDPARAVVHLVPGVVGRSAGLRSKHGVMDVYIGHELVATSGSGLWRGWGRWCGGLCEAARDGVAATRASVLRHSRASAGE